MAVTGLENHVAGRTASRSWRWPVIFAIGGILLVGLLVSASHHGRELMEASKSAEAAQIADEDDTFCRHLDLVVESPLYDKCKRGLDQIRMKHSERLNAHAMGVF
jgi:hypothetical protein